MFALKWRDKKEVSLLTTVHSMRMETRLSARKRQTERPIAVHEYNRFMRGIDKLNQRVAYIKY